MSQQHNHDGSTVAPSAVRATSCRTGGAREQDTLPRAVITGINKTSRTGPVLTGDNLIQTERAEFWTDGKRGGITLHPIPLESAPPQVAHVDWFAFTMRPQKGEDAAWLVQQLPQLLGVATAIPYSQGKRKGKRKTKSNGWGGYDHRYILSDGQEADYGLLAYGGEFQRGTLHLELNAQGCALVPDWERVKAWGEQHNVTITRLDLAHDDLAGEAVTLDIALDWLQAGQFNLNGRPAKARLIDDFDAGDGKTLYIGTRASGKLGRFYEKGRQLGDPESPWVRVEVEFRAKNRVIPWQALICPGQYLAGAYPCLNFPSSIQSKIKTLSKAAKISLAASIHHARRAVGKLINVLMEVHGGDALSVVNELKRPGTPKRLIGLTRYLPDITIPCQMGVKSQGGPQDAVMVT